MVTVHEGRPVEHASNPGMAATAATGHDLVELRVPATGAYLAVLRTAAAGLAARLDFTLDEIEDLRIAVDEACALVLPTTVPGADLRCTFAVAPDALSVTVSAPTDGGRPPSRDTFAWTVLTALAGEVESSVDDAGVLSVTMRKQRQRTGAA